MGFIVLSLGVIYWCNQKQRKVTATKPVEAIKVVNVGETKPVNKEKTQFVILSFDGSESLVMWEATRNFAKEMTANGEKLNFTYFVSGVYFLGPAESRNYLPPEHPVGTSAIGFSKTEDEIQKRWEEVSLARAEGNEIASHLNGHFDGTTWTKSDWQQEISQFKKFVPTSDLVGIRTPLLGRNDNFYQEIPSFGFKYDSSSVGKMGDWPVKNKYGTWEIPLVSINIPGINKNTLSMDYNIYLTQTGGKDVLRRGTTQWNTSLSQVTKAFENYFGANYKGSRAPVVIGNHFSAWNDGLYWEAMKNFAREVCGKPEVRCATFSELEKYLDSQ